MKRSILFLQFLFVLNIHAFSANNDTTLWKHLRNAIEVGSKQYINKEECSLSKYYVFAIKIMSFSRTQGEFSISYIYSDDGNNSSVNSINASNYLELNNKLILIRTDSLKKSFTLRSGFPLINENIKKKTHDILNPPNVGITGQPSSLMIFTYKRGKISSKYFDFSPRTEYKYWYFNDKR